MGRVIPWAGFFLGFQACHARREEDILVSFWRKGMQRAPTVQLSSERRKTIASIEPMTRQKVRAGSSAILLQSRQCRYYHWGCGSSSGSQGLAATAPRSAA